MRGVEERVASLEKKLTFVDLNMEDPVEPTVGTPPTHEPQQHSCNTPNFVIEMSCMFV